MPNWGPFCPVPSLDRCLYEGCHVCSGQLVQPAFHPWVLRKLFKKLLFLGTGRYALRTTRASGTHAWLRTPPLTHSLTLTHSLSYLLSNANTLGHRTFCTCTCTNSVRCFCSLWRLPRRAPETFWLCVCCVCSATGWASWQSCSTGLKYEGQSSSNPETRQVSETH